MAEFLPNGFPQIHLRFYKSTFMTSPKFRFFRTPVPNYLFIPTEQYQIYVQLRNDQLHVSMNKQDTYAFNKIYNNPLNMELLNSLMQLYCRLYLWLCDFRRCQTFQALAFEKRILIIFSFIINVMLLIDSILLLLIIVGLHLIKFRYPNFLFFCKGSILFLPPDQQKIQQKNQKKSKKDKEQAQIKILQVQYNHVKDYPMADQYDRIMFVISGLVIYLPIKWALYSIVDLIKGQPFTIPSSSFTFVVCLVILIYTIKLGLHIFWISSYNLKYCFLISISTNIVFFMLYLTMSGLGSYDRELDWAINDYRKQLSIIFSKKLGEQNLSVKSIIFIILIINTLFTLICIPTVIKFGNWYTKTLKQVYYEDQQTGKIQNAQQRKEQLAKQAELKIKSKKSIRLLNLYLVLIIIFLFFSHSYSKNFLNQGLIDLIRIVIMGLIIFINCKTLKDAIQFNGSFAYKFISQYLNSNSIQQKKKLKQRIIPYIYYIWYHKFQFMFRVFIPVLLFMMVIDWKYMHLDDTPLQSQPIISHTHCGVETNQLKIIQNLYKCESALSNDLVHKISEPFLNGVMIAGQNSEQISSAQEKIGKYGLLNSEFMQEFIEQILWYLNVTVYAMTIVYILFLRKTVYDI